MNALDRAIQYLNAKPRTRKQVESYLKNKEFHEDEIMQALAELEEYHYIDDENYARMYIEMGFEKKRGIARIRRELAEKGVDRETVETAINSLDSMPDENDMAFEIGESVVDSALSGRELSQLDYAEIQKLRGRIARRLAGRGFSAETAYRVARELTS